jgi:phage FluMu protein Com
MTEIRCKKCNRLLMKAAACYGEIKCPKCGYCNEIIALDKKSDADKLSIPIMGRR